MGRHRCLEYVAGSGQVDPSAVLPRTHDDECEVDDDVGVGDQGIDGRAITDVALPVLDFGPSLIGRVEGSAGHPDDAPYFGMPGRVRLPPICRCRPWAP